MSDKNNDCILKACAITAGTALLLVCIYLYLGDDCMRKWIEANLWTKIVLTAVAILVLGGIIVEIWRCKTNCYSNDYKDFLPVYNSGVMVVRENNTGSIKSCTVTHYDSLEAYADNASPSDKAYVYDSKNIINAGALAKLCENKNIELQFMDAKTKLNINTSKNTKTDNNKQ